MNKELKPLREGLEQRQVKEPKNIPPPPPPPSPTKTTTTTQPPKK